METELLDIVDENDKVIGEATRKEVHEKGYFHRCVYFYILNREGKIFVSQRSKRKETFKEYWSIALGGHVGAGDSYENTVVREISEEAGIKEKPIFITFYKNRYGNCNENVMIYAFITNKRIKLNPEEFKTGRFMSFREIKKMLKKERKFLPETKDLLKILENWLKKR